MVDEDETFNNFLERRAKRKGRRASQARRPLDKVLRRSNRSKGKPVTVNYRVTLEWKSKLARLAGEEDITMTETLERALDVYERSLKRKR